jgi:hypothetical protein
MYNNIGLAIVNRDVSDALWDACRRGFDYPTSTTISLAYFSFTTHFLSLIESLLMYL